MISFEEFKDMYELQEFLEIQIDGEHWRDKEHDWSLCIFMECAEIIDCFPWKHWKDTEAEPDRDKLAGEIVDVWHFIMAAMLQGDTPVEGAYEIFRASYDEFQPAGQDASPAYAARNLAISVVVEKAIPFQNLWYLCSWACMTPRDLYVLYVSKNVLNQFRQDNGYKQGRYLKNWAGREDTEHLYELTESLEEFSMQNLYVALQQRYNLVTTELPR